MQKYNMWQAWKGKHLNWLLGNFSSKTPDFILLQFKLLPLIQPSEDRIAAYLFQTTYPNKEFFQSILEVT